MTDQEIYDPEFVADLFDRCSSNYRWWSAVSSFGFVQIWRWQCVGLLKRTKSDAPVIVDLMAGTGEVWPYLLRRFPQLKTITALDISKRMHTEAVEKLHSGYKDRITHFQANALETDLPADHADALVSTFGLKTFDKDQQVILANQIARILKSGGTFSLIEASDPKGWMFRPFYRFYLDRLLPKVESLFLKGAQDFSMIGAYTRNFESCEHFAAALKGAGLDVELKQHFFGCATSVSGTKL